MKFSNNVKTKQNKPNPHPTRFFSPLPDSQRQITLKNRNKSSNINMLLLIGTILYEKWLFRDIILSVMLQGNPTYKESLAWKILQDTDEHL